MLQGAEVTANLVSGAAWKEAKKGDIGLFRKKREDESETVEDEEKDDEVLSLSSLYSYVTNTSTDR